MKIVTEQSLESLEPQQVKQERIYKKNSAIKGGFQFLGKSVILPISNRPGLFSASLNGQPVLVSKIKRGYCTSAYQESTS